MPSSPIVKVLEDNCVNCHQCISACPTKYANNGHHNVIQLQHDLCIGCGECIKACTHNARVIIDDKTKALIDLRNKVKMIAIVAPAIASNFPGKYLNFNGWLKSLGVNAIFDVSFGAELTVKSYIEYIKQNKPETVIAQPCPAIVSYIQIFKPELIPYLAPAHSPMLHTIKMIKEFYPEFNDHKILIISPCIAKKREFDETGYGDYNVTISNLIEHIKENHINLSAFPEIGYSNPSAERASLFSTPGGLLETAEREYPGIKQKARKIEGPKTVYAYLDQLEEAIALGVAPLLIDCLNCEAGCNGGTGTKNLYSQFDKLEYHVNNRSKEQISNYQGITKIQETINNYWKLGLYDRSYENKHHIFKQLVLTPSKEQLWEVLNELHKHTEKDLYNCSSCGYNSCNDMAIAIFNGLNKRQNCFHFNHKEIEKQNIELDQTIESSMLKINQQNKSAELQKQNLIKRTEDILHFIENIRELIK